MASAVIGGMMSEGFKMSDVILFDRHIEKMKPFADNGAVVAPSIEEAASMADCIMICVRKNGITFVIFFSNIVRNKSYLFKSVTNLF